MLCGMSPFNITIIFFLVFSLGHLAVTLLSVILAYLPGTRSNQFTAMWLGLFGLVLDAQTWFVLYRTAVRSFFTPLAFIRYAFLVVTLSLTIIICYAIAHHVFAACIAASWLVPACIILLQAGTVATTTDEEMRQSRRLSDSGRLEDNGRLGYADGNGDQRNYLRGYWCILNVRNVLAWSSLFFVCFFGFWLAFQGGFIAHDALNFSAPGRLHEIVLATNHTDPITRKLHILCNNITAAHNVSTFVFEADLGAFSTSYVAIMDELEASNRRACAYDRAGYGWSDVGDSPVTPFQMVDSLDALLTAANETGPFIMVGHGYGGRLVQLYAYLYPNNVSGIALLNTFGRRPEGFSFSDQHTKSMYDLARLASPLGWARLYTGVRPVNDYQPERTRAMHTSKLGSNEEWDTRKKEFGNNGQAVDLVLRDLSGSDESTNEVADQNSTKIQWPSLKNKNTPVLLLPAGWAVKKSDRFGEYQMDVTNEYQQTLSRNATIKICASGEHDAEDVYNKGKSAMYECKAATCIGKGLLQKFNGV